MIKLEAFLNFAENLNNNLHSDDDCIEIRNCISRAYYYAFHFGRERFKNDKRANKLFGHDEQAHRNLKEFFDVINQPDIAQRLKSFKNLRNKADYDLNENFTKKDAENSLKTARLLVGRMSRNQPQT